MKITDIELIRFHLPTRSHGTKWGYGADGEVTDGVQAITRISTDDGHEGFTTGGVHSYFYGPSPAEIENLVKPLLLGQDPLDRTLLWQWMKGHRRFSEALTGNIDSALWDLAGRAARQSVSQLLGRARSKVRAYASTAPNLGPPEVYAQLALDCRDRGYTAFKVHAYIYADPVTLAAAPGKPAFPKADIAVCEAVADAVGDSMTLMLDPWGIYTFQEALYVGKEIERLGYYFYEHPMDEIAIEPYRRLSAELDIPVCGPELVPGMHYSRAEWFAQKATDIGRIDINFGGITACRRAVDMYESFGMPCEMHVGGFGNAAILGATTAETCEFFERGLLYPLDHPLGDYDRTPPYLNKPCDPMDADGNVVLPTDPGLGYDFNWDYIDANRITE
jgi:L-alanine-DL-glutamate epimerase-like enolase superfamily enzyme